MSSPTLAIPTPKTGDELAEMLADPKASGEILKDRDTLAAFIQAYADKSQGDGTDLRRDIAAEVQLGLQAFLKDANDKDGATPAEGVKRLNLDPQTSPQGFRTSHRQATAYNPKAPGAFLDKHFEDAADFFISAWHAQPDQKIVAKMAGLQSQVRNSFGSIVPADGGFLVPEHLRAQLLALALENSVVRPRATVIPMDSARVPFPMIDSTTNVGSVFGGMVAYWGEESAALTESQAKFGRVTLDAKKLTGYCLVPNELLQDSLISFAALIEMLWPKALAFFEDIGFTTGSGTGEPLGWLGSNNPASIAVAAETGQPAATVVLENVIKMYSRMLPASLSSAVWIVSPDVIPELFTLALSVGTGGSPVMVSNVAGPAPVTIFGRPVIVTEKPSIKGTRGDIAFVDLSYYLVGDRMQMSAESSKDYRFANDQTAYRIIQRVDGRPWIQSPITPANGSPTLSPFVELATRP